MQGMLLKVFNDHPARYGLGLYPSFVSITHFRFCHGGSKDNGKGQDAATMRER